jgi:integrase
MPTIRERNGQWQVQVRLRGFTPRSRSFSKESTSWEQARQWGLEEERKLKLADTPTVARELLRKETLGGLLQRYREETQKPGYQRKKSHDNELVMLKAFEKNEPALCSKSLGELQANGCKDFQRYAERRLAQGREPSTVRRELNVIRTIFRMARRRWDLPVDPFKGIELPPEPEGRERVLSKQERIDLWKATLECRGLHQVFLWQALISTALGTGIRRGELLKLQWKDIDFETGTLMAPPGKRSPRRPLPMSRGLWSILREYHDLGIWSRGRSLGGAERTPQSRVFPLTGSALEQAWRRLCKRAKIEVLTFHDLRHTAATWFNILDLSQREVEYMLGQKGHRYTHAELERVREKLDKGDVGREIKRNERGHMEVRPGHWSSHYEVGMMFAHGFLQSRRKHGGRSEK